MHKKSEKIVHDVKNFVFNALFARFLEIVIDTFFLWVYNSHIERQWSRRKRNDFLRLF